MMTVIENLPNPECEGGYTTQQLQTILGPRLREFEDWMYGQTMMFCEGRRWHPDAQEYYGTCDTPHGIVVYRWDLERFLLNLPVID